MTVLRKFVFFLFLVTVLEGCSSSAPKSDESILPSLKILIPEVTETPTDYADKKLVTAGLPAEFLEQIHSHYFKKNSSEFAQASKIIELNVFGFLAQSNYPAHDTPLAQKKITAYLKEHHHSFLAAKKQFPVSSEAIASLLWVETRHGKNMGTFSMPFVYYSLILGSHPLFIKEMVSLLPEKLAKNNPKNLTLTAAQEKVIERCKAKADWATTELKAVYQIQAEKNFNPFSHKASFAGAFGISQFIPSTYLKSAVSEFRRKPDLFKHSDAILSVAHFLQTNGWINGNAEAEAQALFSYNRSKDYGAVILKLANEVSSPTLH